MHSNTAGVPPSSLCSTPCVELRVSVYSASLNHILMTPWHGFSDAANPLAYIEMLSMPASVREGAMLESRKVP